MPKEEVWERFRSSILESTPLIRACRACTSMEHVFFERISASVDPFSILQRYSRYVDLRSVTSTTNELEHCKLNVLVLQLPRFDQNGGKLEFAKGAIPLRVLNNEFMLKSVICHSGNSLIDGYFYCEDELEKQTHLADVYLLFYEKVMVEVAVAVAVAEVKKDIVKHVEEVREEVNAVWDETPLQLTMIIANGKKYWLGVELEKQGSGKNLKRVTACKKGNSSEFVTAKYIGDTTIKRRDETKVFGGKDAVLFLVEDEKLMKFLRPV